MAYIKVSDMFNIKRLRHKVIKHHEMCDTLGIRHVIEIENDLDERFSLLDGAKIDFQEPDFYKVSFLEYNQLVVRIKRQDILKLAIVPNNIVLTGEFNVGTLLLRDMGNEIANGPIICAYGNGIEIGQLIYNTTPTFSGSVHIKRMVITPAKDGKGQIVYVSSSFEGECIDRLDIPEGDYILDFRYNQIVEGGYVKRLTETLNVEYLSLKDGTVFESNNEEDFMKIYNRMFSKASKQYKDGIHFYKPVEV